MPEKYICAECAHEQNDMMRNCDICKSFRVVLRSTYDMIQAAPPKPPEPTIKKELYVMHDTPERAPGLRPSLQTQLVNVTNPNDGSTFAAAIDDKGVLCVCLHQGTIRIEDQRR